MPPVTGAVRGALWMAAASLGFVGVVVFARLLTRSMPPIEIVFWRSLVGVVIAVPMVVQAGPMVLRTRRLPMHLLRAGFAILAMFTYFWAVATLPIATATALLFLIPIYTTVLAGLVLGETVGRARWIATLVGFLGALVIIRPGFVPFTLPLFLMIVSSLSYAGAWASVKVLTRTDAPAVTVFYLNILVVPLTLIPSLFVWVTPGWAELPALVGLGVSGWSAHFCQARAFAAADASALMPYDFLRLPLVAWLGWVLFTESISVWVWLGAAIIFASAWAITVFEARRAGAAPT